MTRWLHISDLHLGNDEMSSLNMRKRLLPFLKENIGSIDYIFLTGDIRTAGPRFKGFTDEMSGYIIDICKTCNIDTSRLFIVPGNHDINRDAAGRDDAIRRIMFKRNGYYKPKVGKIEDYDHECIWHGEDEFRNFLSNFYSEDRLRLYQNPTQPHFNIETEDFNILHLDSCISYTKDQEAYDLIIGTSSLLKTLESLNKSKPTILITHYPITSLLQDEEKAISILLQQENARLWLAGHEHDHVLKRMGYLDMLQAGELRYEENASASFLIGEYNPESFKCEVRAYRWFDEGWAQYPYVDLDADKKDIYKFELRPSDPECVPRLVKLTKKANSTSFHKLPKHLNKALFPAIESDGAVFNLYSLLEDSWKNENKNVILLGNGGMGKSTMLLDYCKEISKPVLYISAENMQSMRIGIEEYCLQTLFDGDSKALWHELAKKMSEPSLIIILDGLNEVDAECERRLLSDIQRLSLLNGIQFLITSRVDFTVRYNLQGYHKAIVKDLRDDALQEFFTQDEWEYINYNGNLHQLLRNPMLVTIYKEICSVLDEYRMVEFLDWLTPVETTTDLFHNYYLAQIALMMRREGVSGEKIITAMVCIYQILPAIAYKYEIDFCINKSNTEFREILANVLEDESLIESPRVQAIRDRYRIRRSINFTGGEIIDMLYDELHLLHRDCNMASFTHQMYRDYLSSRHIINKSEQIDSIITIWNRRIIPRSIAVHIKWGSGIYWEGIANNIKHTAENRSDLGCLISNLIHCFPVSDSNGKADYSNLDLRGHQLPDILPLSQRISLKEAVIDSTTLGLNQTQHAPFHMMCFSEDRHYLAAASEQMISIFDIHGNENTYRYDIGKTAVQMLFYGNYLLINAGCIIVFVKEQSWHFVGEIQGARGGVFKSGFKALIGKDDTLYIYYKQSELQYSLKDCSQTKFSTIGYTQGNIVSGTDLYSLRQSVDIRKALQAVKGIVSTADNADLKAVAFADGRVDLFNDEEIITTLVEGSSILLDAAISGDGTIAVTLSFATFVKGRRMQIWDVTKNTKLEEFYCDPDIYSIHLTKDGEWLIGLTAEQSWIYNLSSRKSKYIDTHFISNQYNKLISYGDKMVRKDENGRMYLYRLSDGNSTLLKSPVKNPRIVCMLNNGGLAAIDHHGLYLKYNSDRDNHLVVQKDDFNEFLAIQAFKSHPFLVAVTRERCSIYHTGTGQRTKKLDVKNRKVKFMVCHPSKTIFAYTDGNQQITIGYFDEIQHYSGPRGWWSLHSYFNNTNNQILDMGFNVMDNSLIVILANGTILRLSEKDCKYKSKSQIITAFSTYAYDFDGVICSEDIKQILHQNNCI